MRNLTNLAALAAAMLLAGAAVAKDKVEGEPKAKKICRVEIVSNSHIPERRVCRTEAQWAAQAETESRNTRQLVGEGSRTGN
ncbi:MAG: hypothetical protein ACJ8EB_01350 [Allosphingosinicella sp.]